MKENVNDSLTRAEQLIRIIAGDKQLNPGLHEQLRDWLLDIPEGGAAEEAICRWAEENISAKTTAPDRAERRSFRVLAARLGLMVGKKSRPFVPLPTRRKATPPSRVALRTAAILGAAAIILGMVFIVYDGKGTQYSVFAVEEGGKKTFELTDGSTVMMEGPSRLKYPDNFADNRSVELDGKAFFSVAPDPLHPFTVRHGAMEVTVLGTEFGVIARSDTETMQVLLDKGSVAVRHGEKQVVLDPGKKLTLDKTSTRMELTEAGPGEMLRARGEGLSIDQMPIEDALRLIAGYFGKELRIEPGVSTADNISLVLPERASLETVIATVNHISDSLECHIEGDMIRVSRKNNNTKL